MSDEARGNSHGSGSGEEMVYRLEARSTYPQPEEINGILLDNRWHPVPTVENWLPGGVNNRVFSAEAKRHGFMAYETAMALMHTFIANTPGLASCLEMRLVKVKFKYSFSTEEVGVSPAYSNFYAERDAMFNARADNAEARKGPSA